MTRYLADIAPAVFLNLRMALVAIGAGVLIGFLVGWGRISRHAGIRAVARGYTELIRGTPLLIQMFIVFFIFPALNIFFAEMGVGLALNVPPIQRIIIALTINTSAYQGEIFWAGFQSIASGQIEAAASIGMTRGQTMWHVIMPQAIRTISPPLTNEYIIMFKDATTIAFLVAGRAVPELISVTRRFGQTFGFTLEAFLLAAAVFLALSLLLTLFLRILEARFAVPGLGIAIRRA